MLRDYQIEPVTICHQLLLKHRICYLNAEMRTGKTTMALHLANMLNCQKVLFVTPKKVVLDRTVEKDYEREGFNFGLTVINPDGLHKIKGPFDLVVADESHIYGAFPLMALRTKRLKQLVGNAYLILLSGTAHPESMSQLFHQFWLSDFSPFPEKNFYKWAYEYVNIVEKHLGQVKAKDYFHAKEEKILDDCGHLFVKVTKQEAGFIVPEPIDEIIEVPVDNRIHRLVQNLIKDRVYTLKNGDNIVCDTPASLQGKIHQIYSGTVKGEFKTHILDKSKAEYIKQYFPNEKLVIFYKYIAEGDVLKEVFAGNWTDRSTEFNSGIKRLFICQIQSGSVGINLSSADHIIYYNIDYSYVQYEQSRARIQSLERTKEAKAIWLFAENGIEKKIYAAVQKKKDYSVYYFKKHFLRAG